jgi:ankyrin repeat protein
MPNENKMALIDACISGDAEVVEKYVHEYRLDVTSITGKMEQIHVGNKTIQSENLNILHLAAYHNHLDIIKLMCENLPNLDLTYAGKIPSSSGLANQSEISISEYESSARMHKRNSILSEH